MTAVHLVLPHDIDDPLRPSGGNVYDRLVADGLRALGWTVHEHVVDGPWPRRDHHACERLARTVAALPDGASVLVDGLVASVTADVFRHESRRLRVIVLMHLPLGPDQGEGEVLTSAAGVVTTSRWTRQLLLETYPLDPARVQVALPGASAAPIVAGSADGGSLLCVGAVTPIKGHDVLMSALSTMADLQWTCVLVGSLVVDPGHARRVAHQVARLGLEGRVVFKGTRPHDRVGEAYGDADLLVLPSRQETYGMAVTEAFAHGLPVVASDVGGVQEAFACSDRALRPGILVPPGDPDALARALRDWLVDPDLRATLRVAARSRRSELQGWEQTARAVAAVLSGATDVAEAAR